MNITAILAVAALNVGVALSAGGAATARRSASRITPPVPENEKKSKKSKKQEPSVVNDKASEKIIRGGSFMSMPQFCRAAYRGSAEPVTRSNTIGFRVVLATQPPPPPVAKPQ